MRYRHIDGNRKRHLDIVGDFIRERYTNGQMIDWERLAEDIGVTIIRDPRIIIGSSGVCDHVVTGETLNYVLLPSENFDGDLEVTTAHEFGHHLLGHTKRGQRRCYLGEAEEEAEYFADSLVGLRESNPQLFKKQVLMYCQNSRLKGLVRIGHPGLLMQKMLSLQDDVLQDWMEGKNE